MKNSIKKFEKYKIDLDAEIAEEYAKDIISTYIDKQSDGVTLEQVYYKMIEGEEEIEEHEDMIRNEMLIYIKKLFYDTQKIRKFYIIKAEKYNL